MGKQMTNEEIKALAIKAGVRFVGGWIEGTQAALYKFAELLLEEGEDYYLWADGTYCVRHELEQMTHMSDDYTVVRVTEWDDDDEPMFPGGLR